MFRLQCVNCGKEYESEQVKYLCPICSVTNKEGLPSKGVLRVLYDYKKIKKSFEELKKEEFIDLLPIKSIKSLPTLRVGKTPLYKYTKFSGLGEFGFNLFLKDEGVNPTFSFKDRASVLVSAYAKENNYQTIITASTGNAGSSLAGICASQAQKAIIIVPQSAPIAKLTQVLMYGATLVRVIGSYDDAFALCVKASKKFGWYNRNTAYNPYTIEGKKIVSFELFDKIKNLDLVFVSAGDGCIVAGVYKGFEDLLKLGFIQKIPKIIAVQSEKSDNIFSNLNKDEFTCTHASTIADSISVDIPANFYMVKKFIQKYEGDCITVSDKKIMESSQILSKNTGIFTEPASAAAFAGMIKYKALGKIKKGNNCCVLLTGSGLKDLNSVQNLISMPKAIMPTFDNLEKCLY